MRLLDLDFARNQARPSALGWGLAMVGLAILAGVAWQWQAARQEEARARDALATLRASVPGYGRGQPGKRQAPTAAADQAASRLLATPWESFLVTLERNQLPYIGFLALEADADKGEFSITAEAKNRGGMLGYLESLQQAPRLGTVVLASHEVQEAAPMQPLRFVIRGAWR